MCYTTHLEARVWGADVGNRSRWLGSRSSYGVRKRGGFFASKLFGVLGFLFVYSVLKLGVIESNIYTKERIEV